MRVRLCTAYYPQESCDCLFGHQYLRVHHKCILALAMQNHACSPASALLQVVSSEDLTEILGERPYHAAEMRNIDKFRDGFAKKVGQAADAVADAASQAAEDAAKLGKRVRGEAETDSEGKVVAT